MSEASKKWNAEHPEKQRLYSARYRLKKKGLDLPPEILAELEALRAAKKAAAIERKREQSRRWNHENKEKRSARLRERYNNDPEFRARKLAIAKEGRERRKPVLSEEEKAKRLQRRRENAAKGCRAAAAKAALLRQTKPPASKPKAPPVPAPLTEAQKALPAWKRRKPGRLIALCGWNGW